MNSVQTVYITNFREVVILLQFTIFYSVIPHRITIGPNTLRASVRLLLYTNVYYCPDESYRFSTFLLFSLAHNNINIYLFFFF
jgi:hypothetical protein